MKPSPQKDRVAELMAQGLDNETIQQRMGLSHRAFGSNLRRIRADLGWQAR